MTYRKKLIEVALPLEKIKLASAREKEPFIRNHPRAMHIWWAPRPLAACRAVLFAAMVDDPDSDPQFRKSDGTVDVERAGMRRAELFNIIEELVKWENSNNEKVLNQARAEIAASIASAKVYDSKQWSRHQTICGDSVWNFISRLAKPASVNQFLIAHAPPVLDPFCGGGSIPLEAQRLGLRAFGSDLNPVPVLITKALIEIPPKFAGKAPVNPESNMRLEDGWTGAQGLAEDVRYYGQWMRTPLPLVALVLSQTSQPDKGRAAARCQRIPRAAWAGPELGRQCRNSAVSMGLSRLTRCGSAATLHESPRRLSST